MLTSFPYRLIIDPITIPKRVQLQEPVGRAELDDRSAGLDKNIDVKHAKKRLKMWQDDQGGMMGANGVG